MNVPSFDIVNLVYVEWTHQPDLISLGKHSLSNCTDFTLYLVIYLHCIWFFFVLFSKSSIAAQKDRITIQNLLPEHHLTNFSVTALCPYCIKDSSLPIHHATLGLWNSITPLPAATGNLSGGAGTLVFSKTQSGNKALTGSLLFIYSFKANFAFVFHKVPFPIILPSFLSLLLNTIHNCDYKSSNCSCLTL